MARKEKHECPPAGAPAWMATFSDMMTLVLCFFVLLFAMSTVDAVKMQEVSKAMASLFTIEMGAASSSQVRVDSLVGDGIAQLPNAGTGIQQSMSKEQVDSQSELKQMASDFMTYFADHNMVEQVEMEVTDEYIKITFPNQILFDLAKADLKPESIAVLDLLAEELKKFPDNDIKIEGHTDNVPINTERFPNNMYLSAARSIAVAQYFIEEKGFSPFRISQEGFGEYRPEFPNDTAENRAMNRRVVLKIMGKYQSGDS